MGHVMGLMLAFLILGSIVSLVLLVFGPSLEEGMGLIEEQVDRTVDVREPETMSDLMMLSFHRSLDEACKNSDDSGVSRDGIVVQQNIPDRRGEGNLESNQFERFGREQEGYPGLKDSYLGEFPECTGASSTGAREGLGPGRELGQDMEGVYSRENFKIPEDANRILIDAGAPDASDREWLNTHFAMASQVPIDLVAKNEDQCTKFVGSKANLVIYFEDSVSEDRSNAWIKDSELSGDDGIYCKRGKHIRDDKFSAEGDRQVQLCPGDKGYVKVNKVPDDVKNKPATTDGEAGKGNAWDGFDYYPHIVITETTQKKCGEVEPRNPLKLVGFSLPDEVVQNQQERFLIPETLGGIETPDDYQPEDLEWVWYVDDTEELRTEDRSNAFEYKFAETGSHTVRLKAIHPPSGESDTVERPVEVVSEGSSSDDAEIRTVQFSSFENRDRTQLGMTVAFIDKREDGDPVDYAAELYGNKEGGSPQYLGHHPGTRSSELDNKFINWAAGRGDNVPLDTTDDNIRTPAESPASTTQEVWRANFTDYFRIDVTKGIGGDQVASYECSDGVTGSC